MINKFLRNRSLSVFIILICFIMVISISAQPVYADNTTPTEVVETIPMETATEPAATTEPPVAHQCVWVAEKWMWTVDNDGLATYVLSLKCNDCEAKASHTNQNKLYPLKNDKTFAPTCTTAGANYYSVEVLYEGQTFVGTYEEQIEATGHSYQDQESVKHEIATGQNDQQYHYFECVNTNCPNNGKVSMENCFATESNIAVCGTKSICDICKNTFGNTLEHKYTNGV